MTLSRFRQRTFQQLVALTLLFTSVFANAVGVASALNAQRLAVELSQYDIGIICHGGQFRFFSLSVYEQTGEVVYLEAPVGNSTPHFSFTCATSYSLDKDEDTILVGVELLQYEPLLQHILNVSIQDQLTPNRYHKAQVRAPPFV